LKNETSFQSLVKKLSVEELNLLDYTIAFHPKALINLDARQVSWLSRLLPTFSSLYIKDNGVCL
jgi:hypothetical protein